MASFLALIGLYIIFLVLAALGQVLVLVRADRQQAAGRRGTEAPPLGAWIPELPALDAARSPDRIEDGPAILVPPSALAQAPDQPAGPPAAVSFRSKQ